MCSCSNDAIPAKQSLRDANAAKEPGAEGAAKAMTHMQQMEGLL